MDAGHDRHDIDYFTRRREEERLLSRDATNPASAAIHAELAKRYERLISERETPKPKLQIVMPIA